MTWRPVSTDPPAIGARVLVIDPTADAIRTITWSHKSADRWLWWLPREVLP